MATEHHPAEHARRLNRTSTVRSRRPTHVHSSPDFSCKPSRGVREGRPPRLLARKADAGVLAVRRGGRTRTASPGERIGHRSRHSWIIRA